MPRPPPEYCDFACPSAAFPPAETAGICRTMAAVWCRKLRELVGKNQPCEWRRRSSKEPQPRSQRQRKTER